MDTHTHVHVRKKLYWSILSCLVCVFVMSQIVTLPAESTASRHAPLPVDYTLLHIDTSTGTARCSAFVI
jgi:hypothetical protein